MKNTELAIVIKKHINWSMGKEGERADLRGANLRGANLRGANLRGANLSDADLSDADLRGADLRGADLRGADLSDANLSDADLNYANLRGANLRGANLRGADLSGADLSGANLSGANLSGANLSVANLSGANLSAANLSGTNLSAANLSGTNLSGVFGLINSKEFLSQFKKTKEGCIVFKTFGDTYTSPTTWEISPLSEISEAVNPLPTVDCACGINVATINWVLDNYPKSVVYECLIKFEDLIDCVVPYNTKGKFRAGRVTILRALTEQDVIDIREEEKTRLM